MPETGTSSAILVDVMTSSAAYRTLTETLHKYVTGGARYSQGTCLVAGISDGAQTVLAASLAGEGDAFFKGDGHKTPLILVPDEKTAYALQKHLYAYLDNVYVFPHKDLRFHAIGGESREWEYERMRVLREIGEGNCGAVIAVPEAALSLLPPKENARVPLTLAVGTEKKMTELLASLDAFGYTPTDTVEGAGQYSHRGDILDVFVPDAEKPVRMEFFGDELDAAGYFDVYTQRRIENVTAVRITPIKEPPASETVFREIDAQMRKLLENAEKRGNTALAERLEQEITAFSAGELSVPDKYLPTLYETPSTLFDHADGLVYVWDYPRVRERLNAYTANLQETLADLAESGELFMKGKTWSRTYGDLKTILGSRPSVVTDVFASTPDFEVSCLVEMPSKKAGFPFAGLDGVWEDLDGYVHAENRVLLCARSGVSASSWYETLTEKGINVSVIGTDFKAKELAAGRVYVLAKSRAEYEYVGFSLDREKFVFLSEETEGEPTGLHTAKPREKKKIPAGRRIRSYAELTVGDYVVHEAHGIGRYEGIKTLTVAGVTRDYITIRYAGSDALYVPCDQLDKVSKYSGKTENVTLSKMGGSEWKNRKYKAKKAAKGMAKELIALYAERKRRPGFAFSPDTEWQKDFENGFEYEETDGQLEAVKEIKADMEKPCPMDRLLCGDVGFGKTEVALRAAFKCVMDGKQVAVLVPTTILALQHFRTFSARMQGFPVRVEMLSRYVSPKKTKQVLAALEKGEVDVVIGTHKLLGKSVAFKDLGLLIVDEEQRFGVGHKERLKEMSKQVDVLTLTATPIPRTFNMALVGIRDMSVLEEAPVDRYPVQTYVMAYDFPILTEAIRRELRRGGQVFYLHNRVEDIESVAARIRQACPDATVATAHGQMEKEEISSIWYDMTEGKIDVLVCTTLIETGVDVPNANTLIIESADRMGLAQLHQLRGRVGRSSRRAYAYFTYRPEGILNEVAQKRLVAIKEFTEFGSGFKIAMRDMEIRGAGNLLGAEQSGHMEAVGYDLFIKILENAVLEEKGEKPTETPDCTVDLGISAYIPEKYIKRPSDRIGMYKRISEIQSAADADDVTDEMTDRYGEMPRETENLVRIASVKARCIAHGIVKVVMRDGRISVYPQTPPTREQTVELVRKYPGKVTTSLGKEPCFIVRSDGTAGVGAVLEEIFKIYSPLDRQTVVN